MQAKHEKEAGSRISRRMLALIPVLAAAVLCYAFSAAAWFQAELLNSGNTIQAGHFAARLELVDGNGELLWSCGEPIVSDKLTIVLDAPYTGPARLRLTSADSTLAFQYQLVLTAGGKLLLQMPQTEEKLTLTPNGEGASQEYPVTLTGEKQLYLEFDAAFLAGTLPSLTTPVTQEANADTPPAAGSRATESSTTATAATTTTAPATTTASAATGEATGEAVKTGSGTTGPSTTTASFPTTSAAAETAQESTAATNSRALSTAADTGTAFQTEASLVTNAEETGPAETA